MAASAAASCLLPRFRSGESDVNRRLREALLEDAELAAGSPSGFRPGLRLPEMHVSPAAQRFAAILWELLDEAAAAAAKSSSSSSCSEKTREIAMLLRDAALLFQTIRAPARHGKAPEEWGALEVSVYVADSLYAAHVLLLGSYAWNRSVPADLEAHCPLLDVFERIRGDAENAFISYLVTEQDKLAALLRRSSPDAADEVCQRLQTCAQGFSTALPRALQQRAFGYLCEHVSGGCLAWWRQGLEADAAAASSTKSAISTIVAGMTKSLGCVGLGWEHLHTPAEQPNLQRLCIVVDAVHGGLPAYVHARPRIQELFTKAEIEALDRALGLRTEQSCGRTMTAAALVRA
eukprot:TRINITY_DN37944_c0_g1_i3.p1 TRINITY_DN37944_c0_g1~~TRINITY_DN37944_c0_g1_i3.p1  ORF type:complete len:348 (-),score=79.02 TRINITY_DN37944_c0_g1_i3:152-1195(-)